MKKLKKFLTTVFTMLLVLGSVFSFSGITAYAEDDQFATANSETKQKLEDVITQLRNANKEKTADKLQTLIDTLESHVDDDSKLKSTDDAVKMIEDVLGDSAFLEVMGWDNIYTQNAAILETEWINSMGEFLVPYGVTMNKYSIVDTFNAEKYAQSYGYDTPDNYDYSVEDSGESLDSEAEKSSNTAKAIQKLRWSSDKSSDVALSTYISRFETTYVPTLGALLQSISAALVVAFGASNLLRMSSDRMVSYDAILREFAKLIFGVWFIFNYQYVAIVLMRVGTFVTEALLDGNLSNAQNAKSAQLLRRALWAGLETVMQGTTVETMFNGLSNAATGVYQITRPTTADTLTDLWNTITGFLSGGGNVLGGDTFVNVALNWVIFAVLIELGIRYLFTPIAIADLYSEGFHSNGMRWLKKLLSCALTGGLMYLAIYGANVLKAQITGWHPIQYAAINLTMTGFFVKCRSIADEIVGVR